MGVAAARALTMTTKVVTLVVTRAVVGVVTVRLAKVLVTVASLVWALLRSSVLQFSARAASIARREGGPVTGDPYGVERPMACHHAPLLPRFAAGGAWPANEGTAMAGA